MERRSFAGVVGLEAIYVTANMERFLPPQPCWLWLVNITGRGTGRQNSYQNSTLLDRNDFMLSLVHTYNRISMIPINAKHLFSSSDRELRPVFSRSRTLLLVLSLQLLSPVKSLLSYVLSTGSELLNASNTSSHHLPTKFSQLPNLDTFITSSLFSVLKVLALRRRYCCSTTYIILSKITDRSFRYASLCF